MFLSPSLLSTVSPGPGVTATNKPPWAQILTKCSNVAVWSINWKKSVIDSKSFRVKLQHWKSHHNIPCRVTGYLRRFFLSTMSSFPMISRHSISATCWKSLCWCLISGVVHHQPDPGGYLSKLIAVLWSWAVRWSQMYLGIRGKKPEGSWGTWSSEDWIF